MKYEWFKENEDNFIFKEQLIGNDLCVLVNPSAHFHDWTEDNSVYRSSIYRASDGYPVSLGFRKFMNYHERPDFEPLTIENIAESHLLEKVDGSSLIVSMYKNEIIARTRGTFDARFLLNGYEINDLIYNNEKIINFFKDNAVDGTCLVSLIFEWVSPSNRIVIKYDKPTLYLLAEITHYGHNYSTLERVKQISNIIDVPIPKQYDNITFGKLIQLLKTDNSTEGVVIRYEKGAGRMIYKKIKTEWYLNLHKLRSYLNSEKAVCKAMINHGCLKLDIDNVSVANDFLDEIEKELDYEISKEVETNVSCIINKWNNHIVLPILDLKTLMNSFNIYTPGDVMKFIFETNLTEYQKSMVWQVFRNKIEDSKLQRYFLKNYFSYKFE